MGLERLHGREFSFAFLLLARTLSLHTGSQEQNAVTGGGGRLGIDIMARKGREDVKIGDSC